MRSYKLSALLGGSRGYRTLANDRRSRWESNPYCNLALPVCRPGLQPYRDGWGELNFAFGFRGSLAAGLPSLGSNPYLSFAVIRYQWNDLILVLTVGLAHCYGVVSRRHSKIVIFPYLDTSSCCQPFSVSL